MLQICQEFKCVFQPLKSLSEFCARDGFLRSQTRIIDTNKPFDARFPVILPQRHNFVELLIQKIYYDLGHFGWSYVLAKIQNRYWILHDQSAVPSYLKNCVYCKFCGAESSTQFMVALPKERLVLGERAFFVTGCDQIGPIFVTELRKKIKRWGCLLFLYESRSFGNVL